MRTFILVDETFLLTKATRDLEYSIDRYTVKILNDDLIILPKEATVCLLRGREIRLNTEGTSRI